MRQLLETLDLARSRMAGGEPCDMSIDRRIYGHIFDSADIKIE